jgi:hypothetical protein
MNDGTMLFRTNSSICHVVVLKYFDASKIVRSRGMMQTGTDLAAEAGAGMDTTAGTAAVATADLFFGLEIVEAINTCLFSRASS